MTKMRDVAQFANVSTATVSRVLSNNPYVSDETKRKVIEAITALGYKPNRLASNFRKSTSQTVLVVLPDISNPFFAEIVKGFEHVARERGYHVLLGDTGNSPELEREFIELVNERFVDGLILATARISKEEIRQHSLSIPVVLACEYYDGLDVPMVSIDNIGAAREATQYLISLGHERIGFISGPFGVVLSRDRQKGYRQAHEFNEIELDESLIQEGDFSVQSGIDCMNRLLAGNQPPTAVFVASDEMAVGAVKCLKAKGYRVPEEVSVVGFDDIPISTYMEPELTTVHQPKFEMGAQAMEMLLNLIDQGEVEKRQVVLPYTFIKRASTGPIKKT